MDPGTYTISNEETIYLTNAKLNVIGNGQVIFNANVTQSVPEYIFGARYRKLEMQSNHSAIRTSHSQIFNFIIFISL